MPPGPVARLSQKQQRRAFPAVIARIGLFWLPFPLLLLAINALIPDVPSILSGAGTALILSMCITALAGSWMLFHLRFKSISSFFLFVAAVTAVVFVIQKWSVPGRTLAPTPALFLQGLQVVWTVAGSAALIWTTLLELSLLPLFFGVLRGNTRLNRHYWPLILLPACALFALSGYFGQQISLTFSHVPLVVDFLAPLTGVTGALHALVMLAEICGILFSLCLLWHALVQTFTGEQQRRD
jgi:hypothetical protein